MADGKETPEELTVDANGIVAVTTSFDRKRDYAITLVITIAGAPEVVTKEVTGITITVACTATSTTLTAPALSKLQVMADVGSTSTQSGAFTSSNVLCPVTNHQFTAGSDDFGL